MVLVLIALLSRGEKFVEDAEALRTYPKTGLVDGSPEPTPVFG
jgi:hypothetical protein